VKTELDTFQCHNCVILVYLWLTMGSLSVQSDSVTNSVDNTTKKQHKSLPQQTLE